MVRRVTDQRDFKHTWYLWEWMKSFDPPKTQADMQRDMGWSKAKANDVYAGQQYTQRIVDDVCAWLQVRPYELFMPPEDAMRVRRFKDVAAEIVASSPEPRPADGRKTGTEG